MWVALPEETEIVDHVVASDCPTVDRIPNLYDHDADVLVTRFASHLAEAVYAPAHAEIDAIHPGRPGATLAFPRSRRRNAFVLSTLRQAAGTP